MTTASMTKGTTVVRQAGLQRVIGRRESVVGQRERGTRNESGKPSGQKQPKELVFNRNEKKYLVSRACADALIRMLRDDLVRDKRGPTMIRNLYLDTPGFQLIRRSIEKPVYKEKLRVRTYGEVTGPDHEAFLEIKKKLEGQVYKRRLALSLGEAEDFIAGRVEPTDQIGRELAWSIRSYSPLQPAMSVVYERCAYSYPGLDGNVRITMDFNLAAKLGDRGDLLQPFDPSEYQPLLPEDHCIMEIKVLGAIPLALACVLSELEIYPTSFSKVGTAYHWLFIYN